MLSLRTALLASVFGLAACSGGGGGNGGSGGGNGSGGGGDSLTLYDAIKSGSDAVEMQSQAAVDGGSAAFDRNFNLIISDASVPNVTFDHNQAIEFEGGLDIYKSNDGSDIAIAVAPPADGSQAALTYTTFGFWVLTDRPGFADEETFGGPLQSAGAFYGGVPTASENMPSAGTATYSGVSTALETNPATSEGIDILSGEFTATADFASRSITGRANLESGNTGEVWGSVDTGVMSIADGRSTFSGNGSTSTNGHTGRSEGGFFGPDADEIGGTYLLQKEDSKLTGSFGAKN